MVKNPPASTGAAEDMSSITELGRSPRGANGNPLHWGLNLQVQPGLPEKYHGQRCLVGYSPRGHKESDTTE